jgi:hypothetical protein
MNPELALSLAEESPALLRAGAEYIQESALKSAGEKGLANFFADLAGQFKALGPHYPDAESVLKEPLAGLQSRFFGSREALVRGLEPAQKLLPQLGLHGTSLEGGAKMLAGQSAQPLDFATCPEDSALKGINQYLSEVGRSTETGVSFAEKWKAVEGKNPGPILVMDISAAKKMSFSSVPIPHPYGGGDSPFLSSYFPEARQFKGTIYNLGADRFPKIVAGTIDFSSTQSYKPLADLLNQSALEQIEGGVPRDKVIAEIGARGNIVSAARRLDLAHQAISKWLARAS